MQQFSWETDCGSSRLYDSFGLEKLSLIHRFCNRGRVLFELVFKLNYITGTQFVIFYVCKFTLFDTNYALLKSTPVR